MRTYKFKALDANGKTIRGKLNLNDERELLKSLRKRGYFLLDYKLVKNKKRYLSVSFKDIAIFCKQFSDILNCGIDLSEGLEILCNEKINPHIRDSLFIIKSKIANGKSLYTSMSDFREIYPKFMLDLIRIGEESGNLDVVFAKLSKYYTEKYNIKMKIITALTYPFIVFITAITVLSFMVLKIIPDFLEDINKMSEKPISNMNTLMTLSKILASSWFKLIILALILIIWFMYTRGYMKKIFEVIKLKIPVMRKVYTDINEINIARSLSILITSGISVISSFEIIRDSLTFQPLKEKLGNVICNIERGMSVSNAIREEKLFKDIFISMISVGEETGRLDEMIQNIVSIKEFDINENIIKITNLIEPLTILILGGLIACIIGSILVPMLNIMDSVGSIY